MSLRTPPVPIPQIEAMRMGTAYQGTIQIRSFSIVVRPLSMSETLQITHEVAAELAKTPESLKSTITESSLLATKMLVLATTSDVGANDPHLTEHILSRMTPDELQFAYNQYRDVCDKANPALELLAPEQVDALVALLKKNPSARTELSRSQLLSLVAHFSTTSAA